ncbi:hypothetical protein, partial [Desulfovibrio piger]|uniref:hypothetical protein n=1 Tax=Desulfovibrio piger TaxID=901 RepID=UPI0039F57E16
MYTGSLFAGKIVFSAGRGGAAYIGRRKERGEMESGKEISGNFACLSGVLIEQSVSRGQNRNFFLRKMLDGGIEKAHKAVRANE